MVLIETQLPRPVRHFFRVLPCLVLVWLILLNGCRPEAPREPAPRTDNTKKAEVNGFTIPVYSSAAEQLVYAQSRINNLREKETALRLVLDRFPQDRYACTQARLNLAYLTLGADYRLADPAMCREALARYRQIIRTYDDLSGVCAHAYWYMGWIYTALLGDKNNGMAMYRIVADRYPSEQTAGESPVSWLKLMYPNRPDKSLSSPDQQRFSWAALALLEIVKNTENTVQRSRALLELWGLEKSGPATGRAILSVLRSTSSNTDADALRMAHAYIQHDFSRSVLIRDIESALNRCRSGEISK